jgi:hypothetical protein
VWQLPQPALANTFAPSAVFSEVLADLSPPQPASATAAAAVTARRGSHRARVTHRGYTRAAEAR